MDTLNNTRSIKLLNRLTNLFAVRTGKYELCFTCARHLDLCIFINISIGMTCQCDRLFPVLYTRLDALYLNWCTENSTVQRCTDRTIWRLPHFLQIILCHTSCIRCNRCTFYSNTILFGCLCRVDRYLIVCLITVLQSEIIILCLQINKRKKQLILDHFPENSGHLIAIHLN